MTMELQNLSNKELFDLAEQTELLKEQRLQELQEEELKNRLEIESLQRSREEREAIETQEKIDIEIQDIHLQHINNGFHDIQQRLEHEAQLEIEHTVDAFIVALRGLFADYSYELQSVKDITDRNNERLRELKSDKFLPEIEFTSNEDTFLGLHLGKHREFMELMKSAIENKEAIEKLMKLIREPRNRNMRSQLVTKLKKLGVDYEGQ